MPFKICGPGFGCLVPSLVSQRVASCYSTPHVAGHLQTLLSGTYRSDSNMLPASCSSPERRNSLSMSDRPLVLYSSPASRLAIRFFPPLSTFLEPFYGCREAEVATHCVPSALLVRWDRTLHSYHPKTS